MFKNYLKTAWRNLIKNKFYTLINIGGLAVGLCIGILILLWIQDEYSFDSFNAKEKNIYRLENMVGTGSSRQLWTATASAIGDMAKKTIPAVKEAVRISYNGYYGLYKYGDKVFTEPDTFFADASLFSVFDYKIIKGNAKNPFQQYNSVVINESTAKKYFGNTDAIGKTISVDDKLNIVVSAVVKDFPKNSSIQGNMFFSMDLLARNIYTDNTEGRNLSNDFLQYNYETFLLLNPGTDPNSLAVKLRQLHLSVKSDDTDVGYLLQPLADMHLRNADGSDRGLSTVHMFALVALLILIIACINYINLSTARSMLRAKEVSLRKIIGAERMQLFMQFIVETALLFVCAITIALSMVYVLVPYFNQVSGKDVQINFADYHLWQVIGITIIGTLIISSIYPAMLLSSFKPINALKGKISAGISDALFRRILVVIQFTFSVILIAGTLVIGKQLNYIRTSQLGYDKDHVLSLNMINMSSHLDAVKDDLSKDPAILNVTNSSGSIVDYGGQTGDNSWDGKLNGETVMMSPMRIDTNFISFFQLQMASGDNFSGSLADSTHFILNEAAVAATRLKNPVGKRFTLQGTEGTIIGVIKDFHFTSMRDQIMPAVLFYRTQKGYGKIYVKTSGANASKTIAAVQQEWKKYNAGFPFDATFLDDDYNKLYTGEQQTATLFNIFSGIAIFISCLGLFGLAAYTAQLRIKEIGVRKVLGASVRGIIQLLAFDFIKLVLIAVVIAVPVSCFVMNKWLQSFAYRTSAGWQVFASASIIAVLIAMITISIQTIKAARANPVKSLRSE